MKFIIKAGQAFSTTFVLKEPGSTTAMVLDSGDTGTFSLYTSGADSCRVVTNKALSLTDAPNGEFTLSLSSSETEDLIGSIGGEEDGYPLFPNHFAELTFETDSEGTINASIPLVYVQGVNTTCP